VKVSNGGASGARWSRDGREPYFWDHRGKLIASSIQARPALAAIGSREIGGDVSRALAANENDAYSTWVRTPPDRR
jgi:hypothetical protein